MLPSGPSAWGSPSPRPVSATPGPAAGRDSSAVNRAEKRAGSAARSAPAAASGPTCPSTARGSPPPGRRAARRPAPHPEADRLRPAEVLQDHVDAVDQMRGRRLTGLLREPDLDAPV